MVPLVPTIAKVKVTWLDSWPSSQALSRDLYADFVWFNSAHMKMVSSVDHRKEDGRA